MNRLYSIPTTGTRRATLLFATLSRLSSLSGAVIHRLLHHLPQNPFLPQSWRIPLLVMVPLIHFSETSLPLRTSTRCCQLRLTSSNLHRSQSYNPWPESEVSFSALSNLLSLLSRRPMPAGFVFNAPQHNAERVTWTPSPPAPPPVPRLPRQRVMVAHDSSSPPPPPGRMLPTWRVTDPQKKPVTKRFRNEDLDLPLEKKRRIEPPQRSPQEVDDCDTCSRGRPDPRSPTQS